MAKGPLYITFNLCKTCHDGALMHGFCPNPYCTLTPPGRYLEVPHVKGWLTLERYNDVSTWVWVSIATGASVQDYSMKSDEKPSNIPNDRRINSLCDYIEAKAGRA